MDVSSIAAAASANSMARVQQQVSLVVLKQAFDLQEQSALQLLEALPARAPSPVGSVGGVIDTYA